MRFIRFSIISLLAVLSLGSCLEFETVFPYGNTVAYERPVRTFDNIAVSSGFELIVTQSNSQEVVIEAKENLHQYIEVTVIGRSLKVYRSRGVLFGRGANVKVYVSSDYLEDISSSGGGSVVFDNLWVGNALDVHISGGGDLYGDVDLVSLDVSLSGGSKADLAGYADNLKINSSGGSKLWFNYLESIDCTLNISGGGYAEVYAKQSLHVSGSGGSRVFFKGNPFITSNLSGGSIVNKTR